MLLQMEAVTHTYLPGSPTARVALRDVDLAIDRGEFVGIIGATGSGKSTLAQHLNGLLAPTQGRVLVDGRIIGSEIPTREVRRRIGLLFQFPEAQLFEETVLDDVSFGPRNLGLSNEAAAERARTALEWVGLDPGAVGARSPFSLSGGEMRRVAIAGVLAMQPECLVLDEPTAGLDGPGRDELTSHLADLNGAGMAVVMITHDVDELAQVARRVVVLRDGVVGMDGTAQEVFSRPAALRAMGVEAPQIPALADELKLAGLAMPGGLLGVHESAEAILAAVGRAGS